MPWFEHELGLPGDDESIRRTVDTVLHGPEPLQRPFLDRALALMRDGQVFGDRLQIRVLRATAAAGMASVELIADLASSKLSDRGTADTPTFASEWFETWATADLPGAWSWLETSGAAIAKDPSDLARLIAGALSDLTWPKGLSGTEAEARALISLFRFLSRHANATQPGSNNEDEASLPHEVQRLMNNIPGILASLTGKAAHAALVELASEHAGTRLGAWLQGVVSDHASAEAERRCVVSPTDLPAIGEVYCREPRTEGELFAQVLARLEELREGIQTGPFSDRALFSPGMDEKKLQLWLAAQLRDTPRRRFITRFVVHREPQVDQDKRTDIEVSSAAGKVCIEIKPVDTQRHYSANSLTDTMRNQLGGQYLRGRNSNHGILVLFRLDGKDWEIPDGPARGDFNKLVRYLERQADAIKMHDAGIDGLQVLGIDCVPP